MSCENIRARSITLIEKEKRALAVAGPSEFRGPIQARGNLEVGGKTTLVGEATAYHDMVVEGDIRCESLDARFQALNDQCQALEEKQEEIDESLNQVLKDQNNKEQQGAEMKNYPAPGENDPRLCTRPAFCCDLSADGVFQVKMNKKNKPPASCPNDAVVTVSAGGDDWTDWLYDKCTGNVRSLPEYLTALDRYLVTTNFTADFLAALRRSFPTCAQADVDSLDSALRYPCKLFDYVFAQSYPSFKTLLERVRCYYNVSAHEFYQHWVVGDSFDIHLNFECNNYPVGLTVRLSVTG